jgi:rhamnosyltransferase
MFSNVNAAIRRRAWEAEPFAADMIMSEDQDWSRRALEAGSSIVYEPRAVVRHSHPYTVRAAFRRFFDSGVSSERAYLAGERAASRTLRRTAARYLAAELRWLVTTRRARWIPYALLYEAAKLAGLVLGSHHRRLPLALKRRLSAMPSYWESSADTGRESSR